MIVEKTVEFIANQGIYKKLPRDTWQHIVNEFISQMKHSECTLGFEQAIRAGGDLLQQHFPVEPKDLNELPNHLIEL